jgi:hypothetical protein
MGGRSRRITVHDCPPLPLAKTWHLIWKVTKEKISWGRLKW